MMDFSSLEQQNGLPPGILNAVMNQESGGNPNAVSPAGAVGAFQFMPATAQQYGIDPTDPNQSAQAAATMLGQLNQKYQGSIPHVLAGYNWGQGNVDRQGLQNAPPETQNYIQSVMGKLGNAIVPSAQAADTPFPTQMPNQSAPSMPVQNGTFDVTMPDGTTIKGVPQGTTQSQLQAKLGKMTSSPMQDNSPQPLQPDGFMQRLGMASGGDLNQQNDVNRQIGLYSKNIASGALNTIDAPRLITNTLASIPGATTKFIGDQFNQGTQPAFVQDLSSEMNKNDPMPSLGQQFLNNYNQQFNNQIEPKDNTEKNIAAISQGAATGMIGGPIGALAGGAGGFMQQEATNRGWSPDQAALAGLAGGMVGAKAPSLYTNTISDTVNGLGNIGKGATGFDQNELNATANSMKGDYTPAMEAAKNIPLTQDTTQDFSDALTRSVNQLDLKDKLHPQTTDVVQEIQDRLAPGTDENGNVTPAKPLTFGELEYFKQRFQQAAETGGGSQDSGVANALRKSVVDFRNGLDGSDIDGDANAVQNVQNANASYRSGSQYQQLANLLQNSNGDINAFTNKLRQQLNNTKSNPFSGWKPEDVQTLRDFVNGSPAEGITGLLAKFGFDFKNPASFGNVARSALDLGASGIVPAVGIPLTVGGTIARAGLNAMKRGQLRGILDELESRAQGVVPPSPVAPSAPSPQLMLPAPLTRIEGPRDVEVTPSGQASEVTSQQQTLADQLRQNRQNVGLTPDVQQVIANNQNLGQRMAQMRVQQALAQGIPNGPQPSVSLPQGQNLLTFQGTRQLSAPPPVYVQDPSGNIRLMTDDERMAAIINQQRYNDLGYSGRIAQ